MSISYPLELMLDAAGTSWAWILAFTIYLSIDALKARRTIRKQAIPDAGELPFIGSPWEYTPRVILNWVFAFGAAKVLQKGYYKCKNRAFQILRGEGRIVILPLSVLEELAALPTAVASPHGALEHDLLGSYTGLDIILENRLHHSIVQRKLTPRIGQLISRLEAELKNAFNEDDSLSKAVESLEWTEFCPYDLFSKVSARLSAQALVIPDFAHNPAWLDISVNYTENLFRTIVFLRFFPSWTHPLLCYLVPSYWKCNRYIKSAKKLLGPRIHEMLDANDAGLWTPQESREEDLNVMSWLVDSTKGRDRAPDTIAHVAVLLALASVHTTLLRMVNILYDLTCAAPETRITDQLRDEIESTRLTASPNTWSGTLYEKLYKMDSVMKESQRISPPTTLGLKRLFLQPHTFQNGIHIDRGEYVALPIYAIENDPAHTPSPGDYDPLRSYRQFLEKVKDLTAQRSNPAVNPEDAAAKEFQFANPTRTVLNFGYGKNACPGRFFASLLIKMVFVKLLTEYEFKLLPGEESKGRPPNIMLHEFLFTWPWRRMLVRRRREGLCHF